MRSLGGIDGHDQGDDFGLDFASKGAMIAVDRGHDRTAIGPQSRRDRTTRWSPLSAVRWRSSWADDRDCMIKLLHGCDGVSPSSVVHRLMGIERFKEFRVSPRWEENHEISRPSDEVMSDENRTSILDRDLHLSAVRCQGESRWSSISRLITRLISFV